MSTYAGRVATAFFAAFLLCVFSATVSVRAEPSDLNIQNRIEEFKFQPSTAPVLAPDANKERSKKHTKKPRDVKPSTTDKK